jgi:hypothetical protein
MEVDMALTLEQIWAFISTLWYSPTPLGTGEGAVAVEAGVELSKSDFSGNQLVNYLTAVAIDTWNTQEVIRIAEVLLAAWNSSGKGNDVASAVQFVQRHQAEFDYLKKNANPTRLFSWGK